MYMGNTTAKSRVCDGRWLNCVRTRHTKVTQSIFSKDSTGDGEDIFSPLNPSNVPTPTHPSKKTKRIVEQSLRNSVTRNQAYNKFPEGPSGKKYKEYIV